MKIKCWLGHKSLEVTQIYLDAEMHDPAEQDKLDRAGRFNREFVSASDARTFPHPPTA